MSDLPPAVLCRGITAGYAGEAVLEKIDLTVPSGAFLGVIGPNGGGKTTLLKVLLGLLSPWRGTVSVLGDSPRKGRRRVGYVPQISGYDPGFPITVWETAAMGRLPGPMAREDRLVVAEALEKTGMLSHKDRPLGVLSTGQRQRVLFSRALAVQPSLLLLDEPTASMDPDTAAAVLELLKELNRTVTVIMTSHDLTAVVSTAGTVACLNRTLHVHDPSLQTLDAVRETYRCAVDLLTGTGLRP